MVEHCETVVVGGGQAGLALSYHLRRLGSEHVILERARVAERWRSERWDSLAFQFPSWSIRLPGHAYETDDPEGFAPRDEIVRFLERYHELVKAPVRTGVNVRAVSVKPGSSRLLVETDDGSLEAANVVVATGPYQEPALPPPSADMPSHLVQVHSSRYRNPAALPPGAVLVVGSGASGCQIAEDLAAAGRRVYLSVGRHSRMPRRYRGHDIFWWLDVIGRLDHTVDDRPPATRGVNPLVTGAGGGHDIDLRRYAAEGMVLLGHLRGVHDGRLVLAPDLDAELARGDEAFAAVTTLVDEHVLKTGLGAPEDDADRMVQAGSSRADRGAPRARPRVGRDHGSGVGDRLPLGLRLDPPERLRRGRRAHPATRGHRMPGPLLSRSPLALEAQVVCPLRRGGRRRVHRGAHRRATLSTLAQRSPLTPRTRLAHDPFNRARRGSAPECPRRTLPAPTRKARDNHAHRS